MKSPARLELGLSDALRDAAPGARCALGHWGESWPHGSALWVLVPGRRLLGTALAFVNYCQWIQDLGAMKADSVYYVAPVVALVVVGTLPASE